MLKHGAIIQNKKFSIHFISSACEISVISSSGSGDSGSCGIIRSATAALQVLAEFHNTIPIRLQIFECAADFQTSDELLNI